MMFDLFEHPMFYRRQPSMLSTIYALQRHRMLQDMFFSDFDFPQLYFVYRTPKKQDKSDDKQDIDKQDSDKNDEDKSNTQEQQVNTDGTPKETKDSMNEEPVPKEANHDESNESVTDNKNETDTKNEEVHNELNTSETSKPEEVKKDHHEESHDNEEAKEMNDDAQEVNEDKKEEFVDNEEENKFLENKRQEKEINDSNITVERRTTTKKGGFKRVIRNEVNEYTGVVITTEIRSINDQSMTLRRIYYGDGDIEEEEIMSHLTKDEIPSFQQKWQEAFSN